MPKVTQYRAQSIIYFEGDKSEKVYILKSGHVVLATTDIETGEPVRSSVQIGEFFGVGSALSNFPRSENAKVVKDSQIVVMTVAEFEQLIQSNPRIMLKMLRVFSTQLRRIHAKVQSLLNEDEAQSDASEGLFHSGEYYFAHENYDFAKYAFKKYLAEYPTGVRAEAVKKYQLQIVSATGEEASQSEATTDDDSSVMSLFDTDAGGDIASFEPKFTAAKDKFSAGAIQEAYQLLKEIVELKGASNNDLWPDVLLYYGRCLYRLQNYQETVQVLSEFAKNNSTHSRVFEAIFYIGDAYRYLHEHERARLFLQRALQFPGIDAQLSQRIKEILEELQ